MKRRFLSILLAALMLLSLLPATALAAVDGSGTTSSPYTVSSATDFAEALEKGNTGTIYVKLNNNIKGDLTVPSGKTVSLNLNGKTITNASDHTITVAAGGSLTITGTGTVDNVTHGKAAIYNNGTMSITGGTYTRSQETQDTAENKYQGANSWYTVVNNGTMTISGGTFYTADGTPAKLGNRSSLIRNGASSSNSNVYLTIAGGTFTSAANVIKNEAGSVIRSISGGTFTMDNSGIAWQGGNNMLESYGTIESITGGTFRALGDGIAMNEKGGESPTYYRHGIGVYNEGEILDIGGMVTFSMEGTQNRLIRYDNVNGTESPGSINITGGVYLLEEDAGENNFLIFSNAENPGITISGGQFSGDVSGYCETGYTAEVLNGRNVVVTDPADAVATVGDYGFSNPANAFAYANANGGGTVMLQRDTEYNARVNVTKNITLDLGGNTLTSSTSHSFVVSPSVSFTVQNGTMANSVGMAIFGLKGSIITIADNATLRVYDGVIATNNSAAEGNATINVYGNIYSTDIAVWSQGPKNTVNIDGADITADYFAVYQNGSYGGSTFTIKDSTIVNGDEAGPAIYISNSQKNSVNVDQGFQTLTVENSTITGSAGIEVKYTNVTLTDCTITATADQPTFDQYNNGSTTSGFAVVASDNSMEPDDPAPEGTVTINGGYYKGLVGLSSLIADDTDYPYFEEATYTITSGYFTSDPSAYLADNLVAVESTEDGYNYMVTEAVSDAVDTAVAPAAPDVDVPTGLEEADQEAANSLGIALEASTDLVIGAGLDAAALTLANNNTTGPDDTVNNNQTVLEQLNAAIEPNVEASAVNMVIQPYMDVTISDVNITDKTLTLDIVPRYNLVATTADVNNGDPVVLEANGSLVNAVVVREALPLTITKEVTVTIPLPSSFVTETEGPYSNVFVQHKGHEYTAEVAGSSSNYTATFTNPHGFSVFSISTTSQAVATVNGDSYTSFQDAVDAAENGDTITIPVSATVPSEGLSATISGSSSKSITVENNTGSQITVTINGDLQELAADGGEYTFTYTYTPSSGSSGSTRYTVSVPSDVEGGKITVSPSRASRGSTVTVTVTPDEGYELDTLTVTDSDGNALTLTDKGDGKYTFTMPRGAVEIAASFKAVEEEPQPSDFPFTDVAEGAWYYDAVAYAWENDLMTGTSAATFAPGVTTDRAMLATLLWRLEGSPSVDYLMDFDDVAEGLWYSEAVRWAASEGVVNGVGDGGSFAPTGAITREQMAVMLYRYAQYKDYDVTGSADLSGYADADSVSSWAQYAVAWAVDAGLISGVGNNTLNPQGSATRAEIATILMRFVQTFVPAE